MSNKIVKTGEKPNPMEEELEKLKRNFTNPSVLTTERSILGELNKLIKRDNKTEEDKKKFTEAVSKVGMLYGLENGVWIANLSYEKYYSALARIRQRIVEDYSCKTSLELMLADSAVASYWMIIRNQSNLARLVEEENGSYSFNNQKINVIRDLNKVVDSASRRLHANITLLKELKQPALKVNVKSNNAFIGENQQFNDNKNYESK